MLSNILRDENVPLTRENLKMQQYICEANHRESCQWVLSYHTCLYKFARVRQISNSHSVVDICFETPARPDANLITDFVTVIFALKDVEEFAFTVGTRKYVKLLNFKVTKVFYLVQRQAIVFPVWYLPTIARFLGKQ